MSEEKNEESVEALLDELNALTGLSSVKEEINQSIIIKSNNQERKALGGVLFIDEANDCR